MKAEFCSDDWSRKALYTESAVELVLHICQRIFPIIKYTISEVIMRKKS
jgi:hypothetical protein